MSQSTVMVRSRRSIGLAINCPMRRGLSEHCKPPLDLDACHPNKWDITNNVSTLDKQRICINTQLKSSKKKLKSNVCASKSNSNDQYAITCDVIAYHFISIWVINKCQCETLQ